MKNVGAIGAIGETDRTIRIIVGIVIVGTSLYFKTWWGIIGIIPLVTALMGWCPAYSIFGIKTAEK